MAVGILRLPQCSRYVQVTNLITAASSQMPAAPRTFASSSVVIIDGIEVNDPGGGSEYDFGNLLAAEIERIEVLRGPQSALYGSDTIGGVINITTKKGREGLRATGLGEAGSFSTYQFGATLSGGFQNLLDFSVGANHLSTRGISVADEDRGNTEEDGHRNGTVNTSIRVRPLDNIELGVIGRSVNSRIETDGFVGGIGAVDADRDTKVKQLYGRAFARLFLFDASDWISWDHTFSAAYTENKADNDVRGNLSSEFDGFKNKYDYQTDLYLWTPQLADSEHTFTFLFEDEKDRVNASSAFVDVNQDFKTKSYVGQYQLGVFDRLFLSGSVRRDDNDELFDNETTYRATASYVHAETRTRVHGSYGTGVKNPTLFELFGFAANFVGNPNLEPEESRGWDIGVEQTVWDDRASIDVTYFNNRIEDLITGAGITAINLDGTTKIDGIEMAARADILDDLSFTGSYTWTLTEDANGTELVRRAKHIASVNLNYRFHLLGNPGNLNLTVDYNGNQDDFAFNANFNRSVVNLDSFTLVNLAASYQLHESVELFTRIENATDDDYEEIFTLGSPGNRRVRRCAIAFRFAGTMVALFTDIAIRTGAKTLRQSMAR